MPYTPIPTITVRTAFQWKSHSSAESAINESKRDIEKTMMNPIVSSSLELTICDINWSDQHVTFVFPNQHCITLTATREGINLSSEKPIVQKIDNSLLPGNVFLNFDTSPEPTLWKRKSVIDKRSGSVFKNLQLSGHMAFINTSKNSTLKISILEAIDENGEGRLMFYWSDT